MKDNNSTQSALFVAKTNAQQAQYNRKRSNRVSYLKHKNVKIVMQIRALLKDQNNTLSEKQKDYLFRLDKYLNSCASHSLYRQHFSNNAIEYIGSHTCGHKLCFVCNSLSQKRIRRKYLKFFEENKEVYLIKNNSSGSVRAITKSTLDKMSTEGELVERYSLQSTEEYDLMHLTLTVPHYKDSGFRGYQCYYEHIVRQFNFLRKKKKWNHYVYGGEYGIETTVGNNGLNIHIHALLLVRRSEKNRNTLHKYILGQWNRLTINAYNTREKLDRKTRSLIVKSNSLLKGDKKFLDKLSPKGATIITLENIFNVNDKGEKERVSHLQPDKVIAAVMEAISYHFKPQCFDKKTGEFDLNMILAIMPEIEGKPLYRKFGCLHRESSLNINTSTTERIEEDKNESGGDLVINPETLKEAFREEYQFFVSSPINLYHIESEGLKPIISKSASKIFLHDSIDTAEALTDMTIMSLGKMYKGEKGSRNRLNADIPEPRVFGQTYMPFEGYDFIADTDIVPRGDYAVLHGL